MPVEKKKLLNNVTEEPNLQTKQSGIQVLDFVLMSGEDIPRSRQKSAMMEINP